MYLQWVAEENKCSIRKYVIGDTKWLINIQQSHCNTIKHLTTLLKKKLVASVPYNNCYKGFCLLYLF
jgi:hypothetical protein